MILTSPTEISFLRFYKHSLQPLKQMLFIIQFSGRYFSHSHECIQVSMFQPGFLFSWLKVCLQKIWKLLEIFTVTYRFQGQRNV